MKQAYVLIAVFALASTLTTAQTAFAKAQVSPNREQIAQQELNPAEWREQRLDVASMAGAGDQMARVQARADQGMVPAEWREQRLDMASLAGAGDRQVQADQQMVPAEWREQRLASVPMMGTPDQN